MAQPSIEEIEAGLQDWDLLQQLPAAIGDYKLVPGTGIAGQILNIAAYVNEAAHCRLDITYTSETFDYVPVKTVGLHSFRDERYFCRERDRFGKMLLEHLPMLISSIDRQEAHGMCYEAEGLRFGQWDYWRGLPQQIGDYEMFIRPDNPLYYINGSFIFLDYTDFARGNQVYFSYNIFRNELFAEMKRNNLPLTTELFDVPASVPDERKLSVLSELMETHLRDVMQSLEKS
ncbi:hypothetical protein [uncultured Phascolarctobacterium sp.]|uniref:hypothetical protein n=1 Tax=uncultured Phascolarctobacterium sp. TaxID=512296 RepID=UPI0025E48536|nr:hypothetical protein [uncultured Phascolarctobacterium sp.]